MSAVHSPIYTGTVNGRPVRFFKGLGGKPDMPWHAYHDLTAAVGFDEAMSRRFVQLTQQDGKDALQTIATLEGLIVIAPHYVAQGTVWAAVDWGRCSSDTEFQYAKEGVQALDALMANVPHDRFLNYIGQAFRNSNGMEADHD